MTAHAPAAHTGGEGSLPFFRSEPANGTIFMNGHDALDLLNRLSTQKLDDLAVGEVRETLFLNEKGRTIDATHVYRTREGVLLLTAAHRAEPLRLWLEKYTIMEDCTYEDRSADFTQLALFGHIPHLPGFIPDAAGHGSDIVLADVPCIALRCASVTGSSMRILVPPSSAADVSHVLDMSYPGCNDEEFQLWRVRELVPAMGHELGEHANPLESGAVASVNFVKGCYIGQEVIARLDTYDRVQRHPVRLRFGDDARSLAAGSPLTAADLDAGYVTTVVRDPASGDWVGIGLVRTAFCAAGSELTCSGVPVVVEG